MSCRRMKMYLAMNIYSLLAMGAMPFWITHTMNKQEFHFDDVVKLGPGPRAFPNFYRADAFDDTRN